MKSKEHCQYQQCCNKTVIVLHCSVVPVLLERIFGISIKMKQLYICRCALGPPEIIFVAYPSIPSFLSQDYIEILEIYKMVRNPKH